MSLPARPTLFSYRSLVVAVLIAGGVGSVLSYREGRSQERERAEAEFVNRATQRHTLTREILGHYEDALFGLSTLFMPDGKTTRTEFRRAIERIEDRIVGAQAFEWVPVVAQDERAAFEAAVQRSYAGRAFEVIQYDAAGKPLRALDRPYYYPVTYIEPLRGNEAALGFDLATGPSMEFLEQARETHQTVVTRQLRLVQETGDRLGVVMILPVYRGGHDAGAPAEVFSGFIQCVFRVWDLLETAHARQPDTILDMLFLDMTEPDTGERVLYFRPSDHASRTPVDEAEFRSGLHREFRLPFGQRDWRVVFRPRAGWLEAQYSSMPLLRSLSLLLLSGLIAGIVHIVGRRAETIRHEVKERTLELAESRRQIANMLHALPGMAFRCRYDDQVTVLFVSEGARELTGWTAEELMSGVVHFRDCIHPDDVSRVREVTRTALHEHEDVEVEYRIRTRGGDEKWVLSRGRGFYGQDGKLDMFEGLAIDITARKNAEAARLALERKLLEGLKLESLGRLAGGIAHDFNNLLSSILGNATMVRLTVTPGNATDTQLRAIEAASLRAADLCRQMLAYAGQGRFVIEPTDLTAVTQDLQPLLKISLAQQARLWLNLAPNLPPVLADTAQIRQIVMNLVLNAADAIGAKGAKDGGEIVVTTGIVHADLPLLASCVAGAGLTAGEYVFLEVRDNGCGMTAEVAAKIFDPFFTTKFSGRGLGLAAALGIVRGHQGALKVDTAPGVGSTFRLLLPVAPASATTAKVVDAGTGDRWQTGGDVLVIEDEDNVRVMTMEMLKTFGLTPSGAADGAKGVTL
jgi:PAS domain S-box-containing protein